MSVNAWPASTAKGTIEGFLDFSYPNKKLVALLGVSDVIKENVPQVITELKSKNIDIVMLTGDNEKTANIIANQIGITNVVANVTPKEKAETINKLKEKGLVMMCGDGINDSVSLVTANIGVSVSSGTDIARDSAQVVIINDNLERINDLLDISSKTVRNIKQNLFWAFFYNVCMIPIAAGILNIITLLLSISNSYISTNDNMTFMDIYENSFN